MASASTKQGNFVPDLEAASEQVRAANDRLLGVGRKLTSAYLDGVERYVAEVTQFERKLGEQSKRKEVSSLFSVHAKMTDDLVKAGVSATRELIAG